MPENSNVRLISIPLLSENYGFQMKKDFMDPLQVISFCVHCIIIGLNWI